MQYNFKILFTIIILHNANSCKFLLIFYSIVISKSFSVYIIIWNGITVISEHFLFRHS